MTPSDPIVRKLIAAISLARGELVIGTAELQQTIGLVGDVRHSRTLIGVLEQARAYIATRGHVLEWRFMRSEIAIRYTHSRVARENAATRANANRRIVLVR
jgi:hypothetical protein